MTKIKHPTNKWERKQIEKKYRNKETGKDKAGGIRKSRVKGFYQAKESEDEYASSGTDDLSGQR